MVIYPYSAHATRGEPLKRPSPCVIVLLIGVLIGLLLFETMAVAGNGPEGSPNYRVLLDFIRMEIRKGPLVEFAQTGEGIDSNLSRENRHFLSQNKSLLMKIRTELHSDDLNWRLIVATKRLMFVPEKHPTYASLFESYCRAVIDYVLQETDLPNPYQAIATLDSPPTDLISSHEDGITAYLVHNIADVYTEEYAFFDASNKSRNVRIRLDNRVYLGEIGSYSSYLVIDEGHHYTFERNPYTLWRNSAKNPLNVFIAPIEETLHITLRGATEEAIKNRLAERPSASWAYIEAVVKEWLAVEEAAVGGLVSILLPGVFEQFLDGDATIDIEKAFVERHDFDKYRFVDRGIAVAGQLGLQSLIRIYQENPRQFKSLLTPKIPTAQASGPATRPPKL